MTLPTFSLTLLLVAVLYLRFASAEIYWPKCKYPAEGREGTEDGDFYDLCIQEHVFSDRVWSTKFTKTTVQDVVFNNCTFRNEKNAPNNFTGAYWKNVEFNSCKFGSLDSYGPDIVFDQTAFENVRFVDCVFDHSIRLVFSQFSMINVEFENCVFRAGTLFEKGQMTSVMITNSRATRLDEVELSADYDPTQAFKFLQVSMDGMTILDSNFVHPLLLEGVNARYFSLNRTTVNRFTCSGEEHVESTGITNVYRSAFNDSIMQNVSFDAPVECAETTWRRSYFSTITFFDEADFSRSRFHDLTVDGVDSTDVYHGDCHTFNFSQSIITGKLLANISVNCKADFRDTKFTQVRVKNFFAKDQSFANAMFSEQEYVDGMCCSVACVPLECKCNVTDPSGTCPSGDTRVNVSDKAVSPRGDAACFPADATVEVVNDNGADFKVHRMSDLDRKQAIHVGNGQVSPVMFFGHRARKTGRFVQITHEHGTLHISAGHYLYVNGHLATARTVKEGDRLTMGSDDQETRVTGVTHGVVKEGLYAPMTVHGDLVVNGIRVSSYTDVVEPKVARTVLKPFRLLFERGYDWPTRVVLGVLDSEDSFGGLARWVGLGQGPAVDQGEV